MTPPGNIVIAWNNIYLDVVRRIGGAPGPLSHMGAVMHLAMYEAVNQLTGNTYPNVVAPVAKSGTPDPAISAAYAACYALTDALDFYIRLSKGMQGGTINPFDPYQIKAGAELHAKELINSGPTPIDQDSDTFGKAIAKAVIDKFPIKKAASPAYDGLDMNEKPPLNPNGLAGEWRDTGSGPALTPHWGKVPLFLLDPATLPTSHYEPKDIPFALFDYSKLLKSELYAAQVREVKRLGGMHSTDRTPEQTEIAIFWANDLNGTSKPPGQLYTITQTIAKQQGTLKDHLANGGTPAKKGLLETARLFAMVGTAMVNASVVAWHAKYFLPNGNKPMRLWRPETAIQRAATDGNDGTTPDPDWQPLSAMTSGTRFSPNFPAYVSGHSTFGAAHAAAMRTFYGTDNIAFTATTEDPHALRDANGIRRTRHFTSFTQAALENGRSRVYLGVHYQFDANGGYEIGTRVGEDTAALFK
ncbi:vanadium-dependent haloperoxidase [Hymenobacter sp. BT186]|uniref:Vanadium-dependent haloperoxidase n=1 Tax=Hymenobacter telluris TaxID=2816474 RepID=A0A939ET92_9BACT|nr:vanadium-dependent haloperoxidase [Hymenobacter telluris]MBO0356837.1 vanadium-dependent haloperoxidase [Hymenobacter telluris]MBW3372863.1 vanadium-dependent haloperoxidase [Hymenobacter norwichensis]